MLTLWKLKSPVALLGILSGEIGPCGAFNVEASGIDCQLSIHMKSEHSLILEVDTHRGYDIMPGWQHGREQPFILPEAIALRIAVVTPTDEQKAQPMGEGS